MKIDVNKIFLPVYQSFLATEKYFAILWGGRAAGKSVAIAQKLIYRCITERNHTFLIIRDKMTDHGNSTYKEIVAALNDFGLTEYAVLKRSPLKIEIPDLNSQFIFLGLDDPQRLKSLSGITGIWWEEISEVESMETFDEVMAGFRPRPGSVKYNQTYISFNPMSIDHWVKNRFFNDDESQNIDGDRTFKQKVTYLHNQHLSEDYKRTLWNLSQTNKYLYDVYVLGDWGRLQTGGEFYKNFSRAAHVDTEGKRTVYNPNLPLHISFDFNVLPGYTMVILQIDLKTRTILVVDEILAKHPANTAYGICDIFLSRYGQHSSGLFVYGDPTGNNRETDGRSYDNKYNVINRCLDVMKPRFRIDKSHPDVNMRAQWINQILSFNLDGLAILVNPRCNNLIADFMEMKEDENGKKGKDKNMYVHGMRCQRYGHASDAFDYFICKAFNTEWLKFSKGSRKGLENLFTFKPRPLRNLY